MTKFINFSKRKRGMNLPGAEFSRQDIYNFLFKINIVDLVWDEFDDLSIFLRKTKKDEAREIAGIDFGDYTCGQGFLLLNFYEKDFELHAENLCDRLTNRFNFCFYPICAEEIEKNSGLGECLMVCPECGYAENGIFHCPKCGHPMDANEQ